MGFGRISEEPGDVCGVAGVGIGLAVGDDGVGIGPWSEVGEAEEDLGGAELMLILARLGGASGMMGVEVGDS